MEETQAIDFDDLPVQDEELVQVDVHQVFASICSMCRSAAVFASHDVVEWFNFTTGSRRVAHGLRAC